MITLSINELRALLRKSFEGIYGHSRDWDSLTNLILWLEFHDLGGLETFLRAAPDLPAAPPKLVNLDDDRIEIDGGGASLLSFADQACDLLLAVRSDRALRVMDIKQAADPHVIAALIASCAGQNRAAAAWWPGKSVSRGGIKGADEGGQGYIAFSDAGQDAPSLYQIDLPSGYNNYKHITIITAKALGDIRARFPDWFVFQERGRVPASVIRQRYDDHLDSGFEISKDSFNHLNALADRVLVPASAQSRRGAGE